jgi:hypothetical protein
VEYTDKVSYASCYVEQWVLKYHITIRCMI